MHHLSILLLILSLVVDVSAGARGISARDLDLDEILPFPLYTPRSLSGKGCGKGDSEEMHFDSYMELDCNKAAEACNATDFVEIGDIIRRTVDACNKAFPGYTNNEIKSITNKVCEAPIFTIDDSHHTEDQQTRLRRKLSTHRRLGRYTYRGGGTCRRCSTDNYDRRRELVESTRKLGDDASPTQLKEAACELADLGDVGAEVCQVALKQGRKLLDEAEDVKVQLEKPDKVKDAVKKILEMYEKMLEEEEKAEKAKLTAHEACEAATEAERDNDKKQVKKAFESADKAAEEALKCADKSEKMYAEANKKQVEVSKKLMEESYGIRKKETDEMLKKAEEEFKEADKELKDLEEDFKKKGKMSEDEYKKKKSEIEHKKKDKERKKDALKKSQEMYKNEFKSAQEYADTYAEVAYEMATAKNEDEWLEKYIEMLEFVVPVSLRKLYNTTGDGCINPDPKEKLIVDVVLEKKDKKSDTYRC